MSRCSVVSGSFCLWRTRRRARETRIALPEIVIPASCASPVARHEDIGHGEDLAHLTLQAFALTAAVSTAEVVRLTRRADPVSSHIWRARGPAAAAAVARAAVCRGVARAGRACIGWSRYGALEAHSTAGKVIDETRGAHPVARALGIARARLGDGVAPVNDRHHVRGI